MTSHPPAERRSDPRGPRTGDAPPLWLRVGGDRRLAVIEAGGEMDIATIDLLAECAHEVLRHRPLRLIVDLSEITFFSVAGLRTLIRIRQAAMADAVDFRLRSPSRMVRYVLRVAFPLEHFRLEDEAAPVAPASPGTGTRPAARAAPSALRDGPGPRGGRDVAGGWNSAGGAGPARPGPGGSGGARWPGGPAGGGWTWPQRPNQASEGRGTRQGDGRL
jgi:anti-sigma B factor antagonist